MNIVWEILAILGHTIRWCWNRSDTALAIIATIWLISKIVRYIKRKRNPGSEVEIPPTRKHIFGDNGERPPKFQGFKRFLSQFVFWTVNGLLVKTMFLYTGDNSPKGWDASVHWLGVIQFPWPVHIQFALVVGTLTVAWVTHQAAQSHERRRIRSGRGAPSRLVHWQKRIVFLLVGFAIALVIGLPIEALSLILADLIN